MGVDIHVYPHIIYPYFSCICYFLQQHALLSVQFLHVFRSLYVYMLRTDLKPGLF